MRVCTHIYMCVFVLLSGAFKKGASRAEEQIITGNEAASGTGVPGPAEDLWAAHEPAAGAHEERKGKCKRG